MSSLVTNGHAVFKKVPTGNPFPEGTVVYEESQIDLNQPLSGGFLVKLLALSIEPFLLIRIRDPSVPFHIPPFALDSPIANYGVGVVLRSENEDVKAGDHLYGQFEFENYVIKHDPSKFQVLKNEDKLPWSLYVGSAGMPGQTAYAGWKSFSKAKKGETVYVSTAAGAVGQVVMQLAKADGCKVIASAGSDEKVEFIKAMGADVAFNYKTTDTLKVLQEHGGIDIYWDNVSGSQLEAALEAGHKHLRVINCGALSLQNTGVPYGVKTLHNVVIKSASLNGFIVSDFPDLTKEFYSYVPKKLASGEFKYNEHVYKGLQHTPQAILDWQKSEITGKVVIVL